MHLSLDQIGCSVGFTCHLRTISFHKADILNEQEHNYAIEQSKCLKLILGPHQSSLIAH